MRYSSTMPSRKQSHYRYQNENLHLLSHLGHVFFSSHQILSPNWDTEQREQDCFTAADQSRHHHWEQGTRTEVPLSAGSF